MNKFVKGSLMAAGILLAAGMVLCFIYMAWGDNDMVYQLKDDVHLDGELDTLEHVIENFEEGIENRRWNWGTKNPTYLTVNGKKADADVWEGQIPAENIKNLDLELGAGLFYVREKESSDGMVDITMEGAGSCSYQVKDKTLQIEGFMGMSLGSEINENVMTLTFPAGMHFHEVVLEAGGGSMELVSLQAKEISAEVGAGELVMNGIQAEEFLAEVGAGRLNASNIYAKEVSYVVGMGEGIYEGTVTNELNAECSMGNMEFYLDGKESDYNYELECSAGNININGFEISALGSEKTIHNGASKNFNLECNMGNITLRFKE